MSYACISNAIRSIRNRLCRLCKLRRSPLPPHNQLARKISGAASARASWKIEETWNSKPGKAKAGDAFTRTVTFSAPDVPATAFPEFPAGKVDGLAIYAKTPEVLDQADRGTLLGQRRDTLIYIGTRPGGFVIPAVKLTWWDLGSQQLQIKDLPSRVLEIAPNPAMTSGATAFSRIWPRLAEIAMLLGLLAIVNLARSQNSVPPHLACHQRAISPRSSATAKSSVASLSKSRETKVP